MNGFNVDQASHDHVINLIKSSSKITLKVKSIGMIPVKSKDSLSWQTINKSVSPSSASIPVLSTFQPVIRDHHHSPMAKGSPVSRNGGNKSKQCPVHQSKSRYASSTGGSSRSITSSSHESESDSDHHPIIVDYRTQINHQLTNEQLVNEQLSRPQFQSTADQIGSQSNQIINDLLKADQIIEEKVHIQLRNGQGLGCSVVRGPSAYPGIFVQSVKPGGAASDAGLEVGDQIVGMNGFSFYPGHFDFPDAMRKLKACQQMTLTVRKRIAVNLFAVINQQNNHSGLINQQTSSSIMKSIPGAYQSVSSSASSICSRCEECNHHQVNGQQQVTGQHQRLNGSSHHSLNHIESNGKLVHRIKAIVHHNQEDGQEREYSREREERENEERKGEEEPSLCCVASNHSQLGGRVIDGNVAPNEREGGGQFKNIVPNQGNNNQENCHDYRFHHNQGNSNHENDVTSFSNNPLTSHSSNQVLLQSVSGQSAGHQQKSSIVSNGDIVSANGHQSNHGHTLIENGGNAIVTTRCKLHPNRKQTEVKQISSYHQDGIQTNQKSNHLESNQLKCNESGEIIQLESSVDLDTDLSILERVRLEKEQIALERKRLEEEQNRLRIQMEHLALERYANIYGFDTDLITGDNYSGANYFIKNDYEHLDSVRLTSLCIISFNLVLLIVFIVIWFLIFKYPVD